MPYFLSKPQVTSIVSDAIENRKILPVEYRHTTGGETVRHRIAPFDSGTTNPQRREQNANNLYAYSYTHKDDKTNRPNPKVCLFSVNNFIRMTDTGETFDEKELTRLNQRATRYDYRACKFALVPNRNWYK